MITPNKFVPLDESVLSRLDIIMAYSPGPFTVGQLYDLVKGEFESLDQFMLAIDVLFLLEKIEVSFDSGMLTYAH